jgi:hypothetical protein
MPFFAWTNNIVHASSKLTNINNLTGIDRLRTKWTCTRSMYLDQRFIPTVFPLTLFRRDIMTAQRFPINRRGNHCYSGYAARSPHQSLAFSVEWRGKHTKKESSGKKSQST